MAEPTGSIRSLRDTDWSHLLTLLRDRRTGLSIGVALGLAWTLGKIAVPLLTQAAIDRSIEGDSSVFAWAGAIAAAGVVTGSFTAARRHIAFRESRMVETLLRERIHDHVLGLHPGYHDRAQTGQLMSRMSADLNQIQMFVVMIPLTLSHVALIFGVGITLVVLDPWLALVALVPLPFVNVTAKRFSNAIHPAVLAVQSEQAQLSAVVEESIAGVRVVKGFGAERVRMEALSTEADDIQRVSLRAARVRARFLPLMELLPSLGLVGVLGVGGLRVLDGAMTVGELVAFNFFVTLLVWPLRSIGMTVAFGQRAAAALERVHEVLSVNPAIVDPHDPVALANAGPLGRVTLRDVRFGYDEGSTVLAGVDLEIAPGESLALVGSTGSGKSTIARLLLRFYDPDAGSVMLDGIELRQLRVDDVRRAVGIVFEETLLFNDTVAANIAFASPRIDPVADRNAVAQAAALAGAGDFIESLPDGYDTVLGERGYSLSGGQRQRIAIARAVLADPRVLILDDATSAVDPSKEHEIRSAMSTVMEGRTTIVIAHRPGTIAMADRVALLDEGRIADLGTHEELLARNERYRQVLAAGVSATVGGDH
ncbi:MAG: ABC transporter ATP-binding protein [Actinomycetota bacterium]|jgi:ATP-binding cassette subfamily B protein|nr:ABC transporter ATP-binding protein [Actinomycetota bacterium]MDA3014024.1 ABC transporter ATP-binding protein [Actinomycetota bacterium]MDA3027362.1 ABC transporter ATP-binding protein [Actinomycetota bacterium]